MDIAALLELCLVSLTTVQSVSVSLKFSAGTDLGVPHGSFLGPVLLLLHASFCFDFVHKSYNKQLDDLVDALVYLSLTCLSASCHILRVQGFHWH